jgi:hypothetical protein
MLPRKQREGLPKAGLNVNFLLILPLLRVQNALSAGHFVPSLPDPLWNDSNHFNQFSFGLFLAV